MGSIKKDDYEIENSGYNNGNDVQVSITDPEMLGQYLLTKKLSESTIELYVHTIAQFVLTKPNLSDINHYNQYILKRSIKNRSVYVYYAIKHYVKWKIKDTALKNRILENMIVPDTKDPIYTSSYITPGRRKEIIKNLRSEKHQIIASLQNETGARVGDILNIKRGRITYELYNEKVVMKIDIIGKRGRRVPKFIFNNVLQERVLNYIQEHSTDIDYYFLDIRFDRDRDLTMNQILRANYIKYWRDLKKALISIGLDKKTFSTHDWRRCVARDIYSDKELGNDVKILQQFLGHSRADTTLKYLNTSGLSTIQVSEKLANKFDKA